jgi:hypothetical protein
MSRIRTLKPTRFTSRSLAKCPRDARTTFEGMWCEADDHGRGIADARLLKGAIWPLDDDITFLHVSAFIDVLAATGHIRLYAVDGETYYEVTNWEKHQAAAYRRGEAKYPPFSAGQPLESLAAHESVQENAARTQMDAGTGNREQGTGRRESTATPSEHAGEQTLPFDIETADEGHSTDVAVIEPVTAQTILADLIDECTRCNIKLPKQIIGQYAKRFKDHLDEGYTRDQIWAALVLMGQENVLSKPSYLPNKLVTVQTGPEQYPQRQKRSATDEAVEGWLALADQLGEVAA